MALVAVCSIDEIEDGQALCKRLPGGQQISLARLAEPAGKIVEAGRGCRRFKVGDRVIVYHISGCGV